MSLNTVVATLTPQERVQRRTFEQFDVCPSSANFDKGCVTNLGRFPFHELLSQQRGPVPRRVGRANVKKKDCRGSRVSLKSEQIADASIDASLPLTLKSISTSFCGLSFDARCAERITFRQTAACTRAACMSTSSHILCTLSFKWWRRAFFHYPSTRAVVRAPPQACFFFSASELSDFCLLSMCPICC